MSSRYSTTRVIKDETGTRKAETTILPIPENSLTDTFIDIE